MRIPNGTLCRVIIALWGSIEAKEFKWSTCESRFEILELCYGHFGLLLGGKRWPDEIFSCHFNHQKLALNSLNLFRSKSTFRTFDALLLTLLLIRHHMAHVKVSWIGSRYTYAGNCGWLIGRSIHCMEFQRIPLNWPEIEHEKKQLTSWLTIFLHISAYPAIRRSSGPYHSNSFVQNPHYDDS